MLKETYRTNIFTNRLTSANKNFLSPDQGDHGKAGAYEREADACVTFIPKRNLPGASAIKTEEGLSLCQYHLVSGYGHVGYPGEHPEEYCGWLSAAATGKRTFTSYIAAKDKKQK